MQSSSLINDLAMEASKSKLQQRVAAVATLNSKKIGNIRCNSQRNLIGGCHVTSAHAEHLALVDFFSNKEVSARGGRWCVQKRKKGKDKKG